jgi:putative flavoprotein involved in K+ transport
MNQMLGAQPRDSYLRAVEVAEQLDRLATRCPVREDTAVEGMVRRDEGWSVRTRDGAVTARTVVVASGGENVPRRPRLARELPERIAQYHAADCRAPAQLPAGGVLVVGSAQSGYQIAEELLAAGRRVVLVTSAVGRAPARHRGRDTVEWLVESGFFDQRPQELPDLSVIDAPQPLLAPGGRSASLQSLARSGAVLAGRLIAVDGERVRFDGSALANIDAADAFANRIRAMLDKVIGYGAPPATPDDADQPVVVRPPSALDLRADDVASVVWCTGYRGDFTWLDPDLTDANGHPVRAGIAGTLPGVWYVGLRWLSRRSSGNFLGFPADAAAVADAVATHLGRLNVSSGNSDVCADTGIMPLGFRAGSHRPMPSRTPVARMWGRPA